MISGTVLTCFVQICTPPPPHPLSLQNKKEIYVSLSSTRK